MTTRIKNAVFVTDELEKGKYLYIKDGKILALTEKELPFDEDIDACGRYVSSGFIDLHVHGAAGHHFDEGTEEAIRVAANVHASHGTTTIFPTTASVPLEKLRLSVECIRNVMKENAPGKPHIAGAHFEGVYFSYGQKGGQDPDYLLPLEKKNYVPLIEGNEDVIKRVCFAPELEGAIEFCDYLREKGIVAAFAHTEAIYEELIPVIDRGCTLATHLYSGMNGVTRRNAYRKLGAVETSLLDERVDVELIADGHHLPKELIQLVYKIKGADKIALVTDAVRPTGQTEEEFNSDPKNANIVIKNGVAFMSDLSCFVGSVATTDRLLRVAHKQAGIPLCDAVKMMTKTPARIMGLSDRGSLEAGYYADLVFFDEDINVERVFIEGKEFTYKK